jgi:ER-bound oxygenase mpaB/B'/Rubber oxygenase, catalytic domain
VTRVLDQQVLEGLRAVGDEGADRVAAELRVRYPDLDEPALVRIVLHDLARGHQAGDQTVRDWMLCGPDLPAWADRETMRRGQSFFCDWPLGITAALFCVSLPSAYAAADGARVLGLTSDLATKNAARRIAETGQMLIDVMDMRPDGPDPDALRPGGVGYATIRGVRLLHAVVRQTLLSHPAWRAEWGRPVNQEDLLGTLCTFTVAVFRGLDQLGVPYESRDADAYLHTWCVIGHLLGIRPELLPLDRQEAEQIAHLIARRHHRPSDVGDRLLAVLLRQMEMSMPWGMRKLPRTLMHHLLPPDIVTLFPELPPPAGWAPVLAAGVKVGRVLGGVPGGRVLVQAPTELLGRSMIRMYVDRSVRGEGPPFRLDPAVAARLSIGTSPMRRAMRTRRQRMRAHKRAHQRAHARADQRGPTEP